MIPTLFAEDYFNSTDYSGNTPNIPKHGVVDLVDCIECYAEQTEDDGSEWELAFTYPADGQGADQLDYDKIILAKANHYQDPQLFRIYSVQKQIGKNILISAEHISYDMAKVPVKLFKATSATNAISKIRTNTIYGSNWKQHHFYLTTDISSSEKFEPDTPVSMRAMLLDGDTSIKGTYGGDLIFDNFTVQLKQVGGTDRNVTIEYGVDLIDLDQEKNISEMITGILPYYRRSSNDSAYATEPVIYGDVVYGPGTYKVQRIEPVDLTEHFPNSVPSSSEVTAKAREWVAKEEIGEPEISLTVQYASLGQDVRMHDAVGVRFPLMGINSKAKVVKYRYNVLTEKCEEIEVGHAKDAKYFNLMDASKLRKGLIPPERIQNESITSSKLGSGSVSKGKIAPQAVGTSNIENESITTSKIELGAINHDLLKKKSGGGGGAVQRDNIDDDAIGEDEMADNAVTDVKIKDGAVKNAKIGNGAVSETKIVDAAVAWNKLKSGSGQPVNKINALETDMAYVNKLFASTAQINDVWSNSFHGAGTSYFGEVQTNLITGYYNKRSYRQTSFVDGNGNTWYGWLASS